MFSRFNAVRLLAWALLALGFGAVPQVRAAPAAQGTFGGPVIAGICVLNQQAIFSTSKVGAFANARYKQMRDSAQGEVSAEEARIRADTKTLQTQRLTPVQMQQRQQQLAKRLEDLRSKAADATKDLEAARQAAVTKIAAAAQPIIRQVYDQHKCGVLLARSAVLAGNAAMDITAAVIQGLDAKVTTISFDKQFAVTAKR